MLHSSVWGGVKPFLFLVKHTPSFRNITNGGIVCGHLFDESCRFFVGYCRWFGGNFQWSGTPKLLQLMPPIGDWEPLLATSPHKRFVNWVVTLNGGDLRVKLSAIHGQQHWVWTLGRPRMRPGLCSGQVLMEKRCDLWSRSELLSLRLRKIDSPKFPSKLCKNPGKL